jgi:geranylgeranyl diphosphate synthase type I
MIPAIENEMRSVLDNAENNFAEFYGMMHYHLGWVDREFQPATVKAGKRIRPLLCLLVTMAGGSDWRKAVPGAAGVELLHNFTLIHDDIQDASPTRRGRPTLWQTWGANLAINSGDAMFALAHISLARLIEYGVPAETIVRSIRRMDETCVTLTKGQHQDMSFENQQTVTVDEYLEMIDGKTAALLSYSTELGALVAGCDEATTNHYANFGQDLGLAFQVRDDILGIWGDESVIGKSAATDIVTRKKSLPVLYGLSKSAELRHLYWESGQDTAFVKRVIQILDDVGAREYAMGYEEKHARSAVEHLSAAAGQSEGLEALSQLSELLLNRKA